MRVICVILIIGSLAVLLPNAAPTQATGTGAPYLYYFSDLLHAFVIERADGTDSRVLADGVTPDDNNAVRGPGWSPSGKWFAWTSTGGSTSAERPWLISADGTRRFSGLDHVFIGESGGIVGLCRDRLLVVDDTQLWDQGGRYVYYRGCGSRTDRNLLEIPRRADLRSAWTPDGQYKMFCMSAFRGRHPNYDVVGEPS
jgi:Tol biopolymer transport system component